MRTTWIGVAAAATLTLVTAGNASARQRTPAASTSDVHLQSAGGAAKAEKKICRRLETTGTRMAKRACHTADQWKKIDSGAY